MATREELREALDDYVANASKNERVQRSLTVGVRLNENLIVGNIQGQKSLTVKIANQTTSLKFTLYVVPQT